MKVLHRDELQESGFAGLREYRIVTDARLFGSRKPEGTWNGIGNFIYLSDAQFVPNGETGMHPHREVDVISIMVTGRVMHEGSLEHGQLLESDHVQVQRAGGEGFSHNEINPDPAKNRMIQLWCLPETSGEPAGYKLYSIKTGELTRIYGGSSNQEDTFDSHTFMDVGIIKSGQQISCSEECMVYITTGKGVLNGRTVKEGDIIYDEKIVFKAEEDAQIIVIKEA